MTLEDAAQDEARDDEEAVTRLLGARAGGARGVVVWADDAGVRRLFRAVTRAIAQGSLRREDVFWMLASPQADVRDVLQEFGNVLAGAAVFRSVSLIGFLFHCHAALELEGPECGRERETDRQI